MSEIKDVFEIAEEVTPEQILNQLLKKRKASFTTEITNPIAITSLDILAYIFKDYEVGKILRVWLKHYRINMIALKRKRAEEIVKAYASKREEREEQQKMKELLLGK